MKYLLTFMFCLFLTFGSYAEETATPEAPKEYKSLQNKPDAIHQLRELKNCTITEGNHNKEMEANNAKRERYIRNETWKTVEEKEKIQKEK